MSFKSLLIQISLITILIIGVLTPEQLNELSNKLWRLNSLYYITDKEGK